MAIRFVNNLLNNLWDKLKYLNHKIDTFRIYNYIDFNVYTPVAKKRFDSWQKPESLDKHKDEQEFSCIKNLANKDKIFLASQNTESSLKNIFSLDIFSRAVCVLSPDEIRYSKIKIPKDKLKDKRFRESDCLLEVRKADKILGKQEYRYYVSDIEKDSIHFRVFYVESEILNSLALKTKQRLYALNPYDLFSVLYIFLPNKSHYTVIFQDQIYHCLCHYSHGLLDFSVMIKRNESLQDYYQHIDVMGEIFYCDWSGEAKRVWECINIECFFDMPLPLCLKILSFKYIFYKGLESSFYAREFYSVKSSLKILFYVFMIILVGLALNLALQSYKYHNVSVRRDYEKNISTKIQKRESYKPMYERIYNYVLDKKSLNFRFKD